MAKPVVRIEVYRDKKKEWRWRAVHRNGKIIAASSEGYKRKAGVYKNLSNLDKALLKNIKELPLF